MNISSKWNIKTLCFNNEDLSIDPVKMLDSDNIPLKKSKL